MPSGSSLVYIAGQYGADENDNLVSDDFAIQMKQSFANLKIALAAVSATPEDVVKITILSVNHDEEKLNEDRRKPSQEELLELTQKFDQYPA